MQVRQQLAQLFISITVRDQNGQPLVRNAVYRSMQAAILNVKYGLQCQRVCRVVIIRRRSLVFSQEIVGYSKRCIVKWAQYSKLNIHSELNLNSEL